ncbi:MAG TPA: hypothetical protein VIR60_05575 [Gammaproteobacteria bacterium]
MNTGISKVTAMLSATAIVLTLYGCDNSPVDRDTPNVDAPANTAPPPDTGTAPGTGTGTDGTTGTQNPGTGQP